MNTLGYTALYRKFRPLTFEEIVGQDHITKTLRNQIIANRVGHAYLFNGGRGTGKTSAAKVFARAINCLNPKDGEPCNECEICKGILTSSLTDVVEMDAASNNSVEDIRSIREEVNFLPTLAKYRVYIIDEVHMLSTGAFNALLKTLEEPPAHVKFILATTEPQKLPATILSRCQRFDFKRISTENLMKRLGFVCEQSEIQITEEAVKIIAILAEGAMRDALSILERCVQEGKESINEDIVKELTGIPKIEAIHYIMQAIFENQVEKALQEVEKVLQEGKDIQNLVWELIKYTKDILVNKTTNRLEIYTQEERNQINMLGEKSSKERLIETIYALSEIENTMKWSSQKQIMLEAGIIKLCTKIEPTGIEEIRNKILELEEKIQHYNTQKVIEKVKETTVEVQKQEIIQAKSTKPKINTANLKVEQYWPEVLNQLKTSGKMILYSNLISSTAKKINDLIVGVEFPKGITAFGKNLLEKPENLAEIERLVSMQCGNTMKVRYLSKEEVETDTTSAEEMVKKLDVPIQIIDE